MTTKTTAMIDALVSNYELRNEMARVTSERDSLRRALDAVNAAHDRLLTEHIAVTDERNQLRRDLEAAACADRDRLAGEVERLRTALEEREDVMHARIRLGYDKAVADSWRAVLATRDAEVARLTAELEAARENEARYLWLKANSYEWPVRPCCALDQSERAALWVLRSEDDIDAAIDAARRAGGDEA